VPGGGHLVLFDSPAEVAPVIRAFLSADCRRPRGRYARLVTERSDGTCWLSDSHGVAERSEAAS
jgi:hypothetical protein